MRASEYRIVGLLCACLFTLTIMPATGSGAEEPSVPRSAQHTGGLRRQEPNYLLPQHVTAPDGRLTLVADFKNPQKEGIPVYVVNRTREPIEFSAQDGDIYLKLESQMPDGRWQRAQAHSFAWCGNSYSTKILPPGQHWLFYGYQSPDGKPSKVRFAVRGSTTLATNAGEGLSSEIDVNDAHQDDLTRTRVPFSRASRLMGERTKFEPNPWSERVAALRLVSRWEENGYYRARAQKFLDESLAEGGQDAVRANQAIKEILSDSWPAAADPVAFITYCTSALEKTPQSQITPNFSTPDPNRSVIWATLDDLAGAAFGPWRIGSERWSTPLQVWEPVIAMACREVDQGDDYGPRAILERPQLADEFVSDIYFEQRIAAPNEHTRKLAAETLSRRERWPRLVELGRKLPASYQPVILTALAHYYAENGSPVYEPRRPDFGTGELQFWLQCVRAEPLASICVLATASNHASANNSLPLELHDAVGDFLTSEATASENSTDDFPLKADDYYWRFSVEFLVSWQRTKDIPLLEKLLLHRGYNTTEVSTSEGERLILRTFPLRAAALTALKSFGRTPAEKIVLEQRLPIVQTPRTN